MKSKREEREGDYILMFILIEWGYSEKNANDLGTTVLMYGPPGTGKTVSAEV